MFAVLMLGTFERLLNSWIDLDIAVRLGLAPLNAKVLRVVIAKPHLSVDVLFDEDKVRLSPTVITQDNASSVFSFEVRPYDANTNKLPSLQADAVLEIDSLASLAALLFQPPQANSLANLRIQGDMALLLQLQQILQQAQPDIGFKLAPYIGEVPAEQISHALAVAKQAVTQTVKQTVSHVQFQMSEREQTATPASTSTASPAATQTDTAPANEAVTEMHMQLKQAQQQNTALQAHITALQAQIAQLQAQQMQAAAHGAKQAKIPHEVEEAPLPPDNQQSLF